MSSLRKQRRASTFVCMLEHQYQHKTSLYDCRENARAIQDCAKTENLDGGQQLHAHVIKSGHETVDFLNTTLVHMYSKCHRIDLARQVFDKMTSRRVVTWTAMIAGYAQNGYCQESLKLFSQMQSERQRGFLEPNQFTFPCVLKACAGLGFLWAGKEVHSSIFKLGFDADMHVGSALLDMYAKCGRREDAVQLFDEMPQRSLVSWNAMITGCVVNDRSKEGIRLFKEMRVNSVEPNSVTFCSVFNGCVQILALEEGRQVHAHSVKTGLELESTVGIGLLDLYAKCGCVEDARKAFDNMPQLNVVSWSAMIAGYAQCGCSEEALSLFSKLHREGNDVTEHSVSSVLRACAGLAGLEQGRQVHGHAFKVRVLSNVYVGSALVDMYGKSGSIDDACQVFEEMYQRNVVSWNAIIAACMHHGLVQKALELFEHMQAAGFKPNHITMVCVLCACSHAGLVEKGQFFFNSMTRDYGITPEPEHYSAIIDLLGRAGRLDEAEEFIKAIPTEPTPSMWGALLGASRVHGNMELAKKAAECLFELDPHDSGTHVLLSNIYAASGRWDDVAKVRSVMKDIGMKKEPGCSWLEVKNKVHSFHANDKRNPLIEKIYAMLDKLSGQMKEAGYVPNTNFVLLDVEDQHKEQFLSHHSEKIALAFGLITVPCGLPIRITKNLRICGDCHTFIKCVSGFVGREIIVRDTNRFHHFKDNRCSCGDYW